MSRSHLEPWLRDALLSALSSSPADPNPTSSQLTSHIFLLQCSSAARIDHQNSRPVPGFLSDRYLHIHAVLTAQAIRAFCQRHDPSNLGMLAQATIALKEYTVMLSEDGFPRLLIMVDEFNFLAPLETWPKTQLIDHDDQIARRFRYLHRDFFVQAPIPPRNIGQGVSQIDPDAVRLIVANGAKLAPVPGWSEITRPLPDPDDDSLHSDASAAAAGGGGDRPAIMLSSSRQSPARSKAGLQLLSPDRVVLDPRSEGQQAKAEQQESTESVPISDAGDDADGGTGPGLTEPTGPIPDVVVVVEDMDLHSAMDDMNDALSLTQMPHDCDYYTNLIELKTCVDLTNDSQSDTDLTSIKITVKQEIMSSPEPLPMDAAPVHQPGHHPASNSTPLSDAVAADSVEMEPLTLADERFRDRPMEDAAVPRPAKRLRTDRSEHKAEMSSDTIERPDQAMSGLSSQDLLLRVLKDTITRCQRRRRS